MQILLKGDIKTWFEERIRGERRCGLEYCRKADSGGTYPWRGRLRMVPDEEVGR